MPRYTFLETELKCPLCSYIVTDLMWFQWGYSSAQQPVGGDDTEPSNTYRVGDAIRWKCCSGGNFPAWTYFYDNTSKYYVGFNIGDPHVLDLIVLDIFLGSRYGIDEFCGNCHQTIAGGAIEIRNGIIQRSWIYDFGDFDNRADCHTYEADGTLKPRFDWEDTNSAYNIDLITCLPRDC